MADLRRLPLSAYDPRLEEALARGCREYYEILCDSHRQAQHLRNTLITFRAQLRKRNPDSPHLWEALYGTIVSTKPGHKTIVTLRPRMQEFDSVLDPLNLGPKAPPLPEDPLAIFDPIEAEKKDDK
jgi:hypothetical protein